MKSILFLIPTLGGGGAERVLVNLVNNLDRKKYSITVQTLFDGGVNKQGLQDGIEYKYCFRRVFRGNAKILTLFSPETLYKRLIGKKYDIVVSYLEGPTARIVSGCPFSESKLINWVHVEQNTLSNAAYSYRSAKEAFECMNCFDASICVAESVKTDFTKLFAIEHPCRVLYNTNEYDVILSKAREQMSEWGDISDIKVVSVGRLVPAKGYDRLARVHRRLLDAGLKHHIYILGDGEMRAELEKTITELCIGETFHLLGFKDNPYKYVANADMFVCSSRREGFSTAVTEALVLGIPVVSTNCSGAYELLGQDDEYGIVTTNDEVGIFDGMHKMLSDASLRQMYCSQARVRAKRFSKENTVADVEQMIDSL